MVLMFQGRIQAASAPSIIFIRLFFANTSAGVAQSNNFLGREFNKYSISFSNYSAYFSVKKSKKFLTQFFVNFLLLNPISSFGATSN